MRRFLFALYGITFASQAFSLVLVAPASAAALGARGWHGALVALALSACVTALMRGRIALAFDDHPVSLARSALERL
ncbi:MAG: hypothetical protein U0271_05660 [Polyangiaceae bacterium]